MKTRSILALSLLLAPPLGAQTLSQDAKAAFANWHLKTDPSIPAGFVGPGSRRFLGNSITWSAEPAMQAAAAQTVAQITTEMAGTLSFVNVFSGEMLRFRVGSTYVAHLQPPYGDQTAQLPTGCAPSPTFDVDRMTMLHAEVVCHTASGSALLVLMHESWWHLWMSYKHTKDGCGSPQFNSPGSPPWECVAGEHELARWFYTVPVGSIPQ